MTTAPAPPTTRATAPSSRQKRFEPTTRSGAAADRLAKTMPRYYLPGNVYDCALRRIRWLYDEFGSVTVATSGGKDSTVVLELARIVARERGALPLRAHFLDQECEYQATVDYMRTLADDPEIALDWYQIPFRLYNATSFQDHWSHVWDPALGPEEWIRDKEPTSIHDNDLGQDRFKMVLHEINCRDADKSGSPAILSGLRMEESPNRRVMLTSAPAYKHVTWSNGPDGYAPKGSYYLFHPIYDWSFRDVWKAIHTNGWTYNVFYDHMFRYGVPLREMRVSAFHHEKSKQALEFLQEIEPQTWDRAIRRLPGINAWGHVGEDITHLYPRHLPWMFASWMEYLEHLIDNLVPTQQDRDTFRRQRDATERRFPHVPRREIAREMVKHVLSNDVYGTGLKSWAAVQANPRYVEHWVEWHEKARRNGTWSPAEEEGRAT